ncbi:MAG: tRNA lysidine(34) synthetase TilS [Gemmatimonadaceae bacterium]
MEGHLGSVERIRARIAALLLPRERPWLLAVSGGVDSMVMLDAASAVLCGRDITVATFDHGTGPSAAAAAELVQQTAARARIRCVRGAAPAHEMGHGTEAEWRRQRWQFLNDAAARARARVVTAHTRDDQIETVFMRVLRGAGARGLAGLEASSPVLRPLLDISRSDILCYAAGRKTTFVTDPSNLDRRHLRNRVRLDLLPAVEARRPQFGLELLGIARRAADWRAQIEAIALTFPMMTDHAGTHSFARRSLRDYPHTSLQVLWPPLAARAGIIMDRRGTERLAKFTIEGETGQAVQLAGGVEVTMSREAINLRRRARCG